MAETVADAEHREPTRLSTAIFQGKACLLQIGRGIRDIAEGLKRYPRGEIAAYPSILAESCTPLWVEESLAERALQLGKVQNLRCALRRLHGTVLPEAGLFSFWKQIGRATRRRGYVAGRQLREGCLYPAIGGGLCQLSNALCDVAMQAGCVIVERHPHSHIVPGSAAARGRDAAIAWNYIDFRFRAPQALYIEAWLSREELVVRLRSDRPQNQAVLNAARKPIPFLSLDARDSREDRPLLDVHAHSCATCVAVSCFRHPTSVPETAALQSRESVRAGRTAYLVDERCPEFESYLAANRQPEDILAIPLDGARWRQPRYAWGTRGYAHIGTATWQTLWRSWKTRRLGAYGAARLQAQLEGAEALAGRLARELTMEVTHVCVAQSLLPFLWRDGWLGGRTFSVLMTRLPLQTLHARLDAAYAAHPDRQTLKEFRAPGWLVEAEAAALEAAEKIITPHAEFAALFGERAHRLEWHLPQRRPAMPGPILVFPGPTAARKGAYELRAVARALDLEILRLGSDLEGEDFWQGIRTRRLPHPTAGDWLEGVAAVVQPALVEDRPRPLLTALAAGIPVIATPACGLGERPGVITVPYGEEEALQEAIQSVMKASRQ
ncbi:MAG TPA: VanW family protein [Chthonomonadaceae bacterium]|nr:VanW family protein [Chthonomonadaceae bacterium]